MKKHAIVTASTTMGFALIILHNFTSNSAHHVSLYPSSQKISIQMPTPEVSQKSDCTSPINDEHLTPWTADLDRIIDDIYEAIIQSKQAHKTFITEVMKNKTDNQLTWRVTNIQPYHPLFQGNNDAFCAIINGKKPARMVFSDDKYIGIFSRSKQSANRTKILVIPRIHTSKHH